MIANVAKVLSIVLLTVFDTTVITKNLNERTKSYSKETNGKVFKWADIGATGMLALKSQSIYEFGVKAENLMESSQLNSI